MLLRQEKERERDGEKLSYPIKVVWMMHKEGKIQKRTAVREE